MELIAVWNSDRAEDIYRIVSAQLGVPLVEVRAFLGAGGVLRREGKGIGVRLCHLVAAALLSPHKQ